MQDVQERRNGVASRLANLGLLDEGVVKERYGVLLLLRVATSVVTLGFFPRCRPWNVESHLDELILPGSRLLSLVGCPVVTVGFATVTNGKFDRDLVATSEVRVGNLRIRNLEGWPVLNVEGELRFTELGLSPVPTAERVLLLLEVGAVPVLEDFVESFIVLRESQHPLIRSDKKKKIGSAHLLLKAVQLDDARIPLQNLHLVALCRPAELRAADIALIECESIASAGGLPSKSRLGESALAALLGQVQVDIVETLAVGATIPWSAAATSETLTTNEQGYFYSRPRQSLKNKEKGRSTHIAAMMMQF